MNHLGTSLYHHKITIILSVEDRHGLKSRLVLVDPEDLKNAACHLYVTNDA